MRRRSKGCKYSDAPRPVTILYTTAVHATACPRLAPVEPAPSFFAANYLQLVGGVQ